MDLQRDALTTAELGERHLHHDKASCTCDNRPGFKAFLACIKCDDRLGLWEFDCLGRSLPHLLTTITELKHQSVTSRSLTGQMDTTTPHGELLPSLFGTQAQYEQALVVNRLIRLLWVGELPVSLRESPLPHVHPRRRSPHRIARSCGSVPRQTTRGKWHGSGTA
ncbi:recombinase family protein [Asaia sp. As-1742]|uniref:recombinase family protein n=1 Tax=Asaia sp. As-1742 TaxID=2608325 RepID=UPI00351A0D7B